MKYSILVLGATISISLFLRICCATHALYEHETEHGDSIKAIQLMQLKLGLEDQLLPSSTEVEISDHICALVDPPLLSHFTTCDGINCTHEIWTLPNGCEYEDESRQRLICKDMGITKVPELSPQLQLESFLLCETNIEDVPVQSFQGITVERITIQNNAITHIDPYAFDGVKNLKYLIISNNKLSLVNYVIYMGLNETELLDLSRNNISLLVYDTCDVIPVEDIPIVLPKLRILNLTGNPLEIIPHQIFHALRSNSLQTLILADCYLKSIDSNAFKYMTNLKVLDLSDNKGSAVQQSLSEFTKPLVNLEELRLQDSGLYQIPELSHLTKLEVLVLNQNKFATVSFERMSKMTALEELYLDNCDILNIEDHAFSSNTNLEILSLRNNKIKQLPAQFPPSLVSLSLTNVANSIHSTCEKGSFQNLSKLALLELEGVEIETIYYDTFNGLPSLKKLFLDKCDVKNIKKGAFDSKNLPKLNTISLTGNSLSYLRPGTFDGLTSLKRLHLRDCKLTFSEYATNLSLSSPFQNLTSLQFLDLSKNEIKNLSGTSLFSLQDLPGLQEIILSENPLGSWNTRLFPDRNSTIYEVSPRQDPIILKLFVEKANLVSLTDAMLEDFLRMSTIDLSNNRFICDMGACKLRDMINFALEKLKPDWNNYAEYVCIDYKASNNGIPIPIMNVTDDYCITNEDGGKGDNIVGDDDRIADANSSSQIVQIISITASVSFVAVVVIVLSYRNRVHLRYFFFVVKFNVMPSSPRKSKLSTMESDSRSTENYEYDVFISYHNEDSQFIADVFLPEIEAQTSDKNGCKVASYIMKKEKTDVYTVEDDDMSIISTSSTESYVHKSNNNSSHEDNPKFRVCLHERDFMAGVPITENIIDCVDRSKKTIIFVSRKYMDSQWCSFEMNLVYHRLVESRRRAFALVLLEDIPSESRSKVLKYLMVTKTYLQWPGVKGSDTDKTSFWRRLRAFLQSKD